MKQKILLHRKGTDQNLDRLLLSGSIPLRAKKKDTHMSVLIAARRGIEPLFLEWKSNVLTAGRTGQNNAFLQKRRKDRYISQFTKQKTIFFSKKKYLFYQTNIKYNTWANNIFKTKEMGNIKEYPMPGTLFFVISVAKSNIAGWLAENPSKRE